MAVGSYTTLDFKVVSALEKELEIFLSETKKQKKQKKIMKRGIGSCCNMTQLSILDERDRVNLRERNYISRIRTNFLAIKVKHRVPK